MEKKMIWNILKASILLLMIVFLFMPTISENLFAEKGYGAYSAGDGRWSAGKSVFEQSYSLIGLHKNMSQGVFAIIMLIVVAGGLVWCFMSLLNKIKKNHILMSVGYPIVLLILSCCSCFGISHSDVVTYSGVDFFVQRVAGAAPTVLFCLVIAYAIISLMEYVKAKKEVLVVLDEVSADTVLDESEQK